MKRQALFLDRDGVVNVDSGYVYRTADVTFVPGIFEVTRYAQAAGFLLFVVTNQSGIARGYYTEEDFIFITDWMRARFSEQGVTITQTYFCPHHPLVGREPYRVTCHCRKPSPGMLLQAEAEYDIDMGQSLLVGDKMTDIEAGRGAGVGLNILFSTGSAGCNEGDWNAVYEGLRLLRSTGSY